MVIAKLCESDKEPEKERIKTTNVKWQISSKSKMTGIKGTVTCSVDTLRKLTEELENLIDRQDLERIPEKTVKRLATNIQKGRITVEGNLAKMTTIGETLMEAITNTEAVEIAEADPDAQIKLVNEDLDTYKKKI